MLRQDSRPALRKWNVPIAATSRFRVSAVVFIAIGAKPNSAIAAI